MPPSDSERIKQPLEKVEMRCNSRNSGWIIVLIYDAVIIVIMNFKYNVI